jgi:RHS repeat-associated protein
MAADARQMRDEAARETKSKIDEASDAGIQNRSWWEEVGDWFEDNWDTIVTVCKVVVAVLGIIAMIIGGPILGAIVLVAALVVLADTLYKYSKGQASLWDVAFAALDCIPGMKGLTTLGGLAKGLKGGLAAVKGMKGGLKGMALAVRGLGKNARGMLADGAKGAYNRLKSKIKGCGDPVDAATGQAFLTETDVILPAVLPLSFTRRVASGYRTGWWFGPNWASTIDQRLEIDEEGLVFVTEDGMLLAYPHPEGPDASVHPETGPCWPLTRLHDGSYRIDEPISGHSRQFGPPDDGIALLKRLSDRNHNAIYFDYDADGRPLAIRHSGGYHLTLTVVDNRVIALDLAGAGEDGSDLAIRQYGYSDGNLTSVINSSGLPMEFTYDERLRVSSWRDRNGSRYAYAYDDQDRCVAQGGEAGYVANAFSYDVIDPAWPGCRITVVTSAAGDTSRYVVDENCLVVAEIDALGGTSRTGYDSRGNLIFSTDQLGQTTTVVNNDLGQPVEVTRPDGSVIRATYNDLHLATAIELPDGGAWRYTYDERGNCTSITDPAGSVDRCTFTAAGHTATITDAAGNTTTVRCDPAGLPVRATDPLGAEVIWERDALGRAVAITNQTMHTTRLAWSTDGWLVRRTTPDGAVETWTYDGEGNCTSYTDQMGQVSHFEFTHFDLMAARIAPDGSRHEFVHDASLRLTQVINPLGMTWSYEHDAAGRLVSETDFDGRTVTYMHDAAGRLTSRTNALGETVTFEYDTLGRIVRKDAAGAVTLFAHDASGRLTRAASPDATLTIERDPAGRRLSETVDGRTLTFAYDELGRRVSRVTPTGATSTRTYDAVGNLARLVTSGRVIDFERSPSGRETTRHVGANVTLSRAFDELGRLTAESVTAVNGRPLQHRAYRYRADGNLIGIDDQTFGARDIEVDAAGRVTAVHARNWAEAYAYDPAGNQTYADWPSAHPGHEGTGPRTYAGTGITRAGRFRYQYDPLGRVVLRQKTRLSRKPETWNYVWDAEDRLTSVTTPDGTRWRYRYDPLGRRIAKQRLAPDDTTVVEQTVFSWDGSTLCEQITTAAEFPNPVTLTWDHQRLHPIAQTERVSAAHAPQEEIDSRFFAIVTDLVGTPTELVDEAGEICWRARRAVWGTTAWEVGSTTYTPLRFPGQYFDPESGLHHNHFRHYDPETGRYLSSDPLGLAPAPNPVTYVSNPYTWTDHLGLSPEECTQSIFKAPGPRQGEYQEKFGYREEDFPGDPDGPDYIYPNGRVYFAKERHIADKYAKSYREGVIEIKIPKSEYDAKFARYEKDYEGGPDKELDIPNNVVEDLNQYPRVRHK